MAQKTSYPGILGNSYGSTYRDKKKRALYKGPHKPKFWNSVVFLSPNNKLFLQLRHVDQWQRLSNTFCRYEVTECNLCVIPYYSFSLCDRTLSMGNSTADYHTYNQWNSNIAIIPKLEVLYVGNMSRDRTGQIVSPRS